MGDLFNMINREEYPEYVPQSDSDVKALNNQVFLNIRQLYLHMVARRTPIFPCIVVLKWFIEHTNTHKCLINDDNGGCVEVFLLKRYMDRSHLQFSHTYQVPRRSRQLTKHLHFEMIFFIPLKRTWSWNLIA
jgi:hypothetical protein